MEFKGTKGEWSIKKEDLKTVMQQGLAIALILCFIIVPILSEILSNLINNK
jgi:hypothetical protein